MKSVKGMFVVALTCCGLAFVAGCAAPNRTASASSLPSVALVVRLAGGGTLSPAQLRTIHEGMQKDLAAAGYCFARNTPAADFLVTVRFTPDALNPDDGHIAVTAVEPNPMNRRGAAYTENGSDEAKEQRRRMQEIERWVELQARSTS